MRSIRNRLAPLLATAALAITSLGLASPSSAQVAVPAGTASLDTAAKGATISPEIFGQFAEQLGNGIYGGVWVGKGSTIPNVRGIRSDVVQALRQLRVPDVRWPGGCFADQYHWRNGIGPMAERRATANINWGNPLEPNTFGTAEFMDFIDQIGSRAYLTVNVGSGTVQESADWLEYMTSSLPTALAKERARNGHPTPYKVKYLGLGNESYGCGGPMTAEDYVSRMKVFSTFTRNLDPEQSGPSRFIPGKDPMIRIAVGDDNEHWTEVAMQAWKAASERSRPFEALSIHHYNEGDIGAMRDSATSFTEKTYAVFIRNSYAMDDILKLHSRVMDKYDPEKKVALSIDEWGVWLQPMAGVPFAYIQQQNSLRDAITAAITLNIFIRHAERVRMANIAQMVNVLQSMILTDKNKMILTPTYHVFRMYASLQGAQVVPVAVNAGEYTIGGMSFPKVDAVAARDRNGKLWLTMTNIDPHEAATVKLPAPGAARRATGEILTAASITAVNTFEQPDTVGPRKTTVEAQDGSLAFTLPPASVAMFELGD